MKFNEKFKIYFKIAWPSRIGRIFQQQKNVSLIFGATQIEIGAVR